MGFTINFRELENSKELLQAASVRFPAFFKDFLMEMADRIVKRTKPRTPVDTGDLRRSWDLGDFRIVNNIFEVDILNGQKYATEIEYGHRIMGGPGYNTEIGWYEGHFMLKISIDEIRKQMPHRWKREFEEFCKNQGLI